MVALDGIITVVIEVLVQNVATGSSMMFFIDLNGDLRDLHVLTPSFPTRRSSDLLCRTAVDAFLASAGLLTFSQRRIARISEFRQLALDIIIREQFPEYRDRILAETDRRLEQYHGA